MTKKFSIPNNILVVGSSEGQTMEDSIKVKAEELGIEYKELQDYIKKNNTTLFKIAKPKT